MDPMSLTSAAVYAATTTTIDDSPLTLSSSSGDLIKQMEETQDYILRGTKVKPKHSKSFNEVDNERLKRAEDLATTVKKKFNKLKKYVNLDLLKFTQDWSKMLEKTKESNPEWQETLENVLCIANECAKMSTDEFWFECESIVQELDRKRQELPMGTLKRAHTSLLFILTRCTRLVQVLKEDKTCNQEFWFLNAQNFRGM